WNIDEGVSYPFLRWQADEGQVRVPDVVGAAVGDAEAALAAAGLSAHIETRYSDTLPAGTVLASQPAADHLADPAERVTLLVSRGADPLEIGTIGALQMIAFQDGYALDDTYVLTADLPAYETSGWNGGEGFKPIAGFFGTLDGQGHAIRGLWINRAEPYVGLFGWIGRGGTVTRLGIEGGKVSNTVGVDDWTGALVGHLSGQVSRCGAVTEVFNGDAAGGLAGGVYGGTLSESYAVCNVFGRYRVGGLAGWVQAGGEIRDCYAGGTVRLLDNSDWGSAGGLVGRSDGSTLERCYAAGRVFGSSAGAGGLVGLASGATDSFWDIDTSGQAASAAGTGLDTDQMKQQSSFAAWDFATVWDIVEGASYPFLRWQSGLGQSLVPDVAGMHFTDAITALNAAGFGYAVQPSYNESVPAEYVIEPVPQSGFFLTPGFFSPVTLIVSRGAVPHEIYSIYELQLIGKNPEFSLDDVYRIAGDIDASETAIWNGGAGFEPIIGFTGKIMGDGHTISDLTINRPGEDYTALFGMISTGAVIENLTLENLFVSGGDEVGGLVAFGAGATLTNCAAEGTVNGEY
ncbi:MAG TPA: PASTA domain-containing protein, partial [Candidatus Hydrogenedentes bacterium]|nr:PASTA domain-containing protein [Candidatus Hydrogenedentota bacterium]